MGEGAAKSRRLKASAAVAVGGYMACSAMMLLVNKLAVHHLPTPSFVLFCQLFASALFTGGLGSAGVISVDKLEMSKVRRFWVVPVAFLGTIFANIKILQHANVETFIVFRASTPLLISVADYLFLGRELPTARSWMCLLALLGGAVFYVMNDTFFKVDAYMWAVMWFAIFSFDQIYIKHKVDTVKMSTWGRVYYTNAIATPIIFLVMMLTGEIQVLWTFAWTFSSLLWLTLSCFCGVAIAYFAFLARAAISATYFTVVGNTCKILTVFINVWMWDKHATPAGLAGLFVCLAAAFFYKQAPKRKILPK